MKVKVLSVGTYGGMDDAIGKVFHIEGFVANGVLISGEELTKAGIYACREDQSLYFRMNEIEIIKEEEQMLEEGRALISYNEDDPFVEALLDAEDNNKEKEEV